MLANFWQEFRQGFHLLLRNRSFAGLAIVTLALGIGVSAAAFSVAQAVLLRPLPYQDPERLVFVWRARPGNEHVQHGILTGQDIQELVENTTTLDEIAAIELWSHGLAPRMDLFHPDGAERLRGSFATPNFFKLLGVSAHAGRTFLPGDRKADSVAVLSYGFWQRRFGGDPAVVGRSVSLMSGRRDRSVRSHTVIGILPPEFHFTYPEETEVWVPRSWSKIQPTRALKYVAVGRLKPGATLRQAEADATGRIRDVIRGWPISIEDREAVMQRTMANVENLSEHLKHEARAGVVLLTAVCALIFLIACVNVALLALARTVDRRPEFAVRAALGASSWRLARAMLAEGALIAAGGCASGVLLTFLSQPLIRWLVPSVVPRGDEISVDFQVLGFALLAGGLTAVVCGFSGVRYALRSDVQTALRHSGGRAAGSRSVARWRKLVMGFQVGIVVLLLAGAGLLLRSYWQLQQVDPGFEPEGVMTMQMRLLHPKYRVDGAIARFQERLVERVRALPGVEQAAVTTSVPMRGVDFFGSVGTPGGPETAAHVRSVDPGYFGLMGIPLLAGRNFGENDTAGSPPVAIISESLAQSLFGEDDPLGRQLDLGTDPRDGSRRLLEIVGVVGDVRTKGLEHAPPPAYYRPRSQYPNELICLVIRTSPGAGNTTEMVRTAIHSIDPQQPVEKVTTLERILAATTAHERFYTASTAFFAAAALLMAMVGLLGTVSRSATERRREIAIRIALGAAPARAARLILREGLLPVAAGLAAGLLTALAASRLLEHFLFQVTPLDPWSYIATAALVAATAASACYVPARRTAGVDPMTVLKTE